MASLNPAKFIREVRQEIGRVSWPTRKETGLFALMVLIMVTLSALFFVFVDWVISSLIAVIIGL